jgi:hypothetical protein
MHDCMHGTLSYRFDRGEHAGLTGTAELQLAADVVDVTRRT